MRHKRDSQPNASYATDKGLTQCGVGCEAADTLVSRDVVEPAATHPYPLETEPSLREDVAGYTDVNLPTFQSAVVPLPVFSGSTMPLGFEVVPEEGEVRKYTATNLPASENFSGSPEASGC